jgi:hypothetical protein
MFKRYAQQKAVNWAILLIISSLGQETLHSSHYVPIIKKTVYSINGVIYILIICLEL